MIILDTGVLSELVLAASATTEMIDNAVDALNRISTHYDWECKEKSAINEYAVTNKNKIKQLQENTRNFLNVLSQISKEFETEENSLISIMPDLESVISSVIAIPICTDVIGTVGNPIINDGVSSIVDEIVKDWTNKSAMGELANWLEKNPWDWFEINNISNPIPVCTFDDIDLK